MKRLNCLIPDKLNAVSFYRGVGPLSRLTKNSSNELFLDFENNMNWGTIAIASALFMILPIGKGLFKISELAKRCSTPTWLDFDDNLFSIPKWNPACVTYTHDVQKDLKATISICDWVSVTTPELANVISEYNKNVVVIPNALDEQLLGFEYSPGKNKIINWRGGNTHSEDLKSILGVIKNIQATKNFMDWTWSFLGPNSEIAKKTLPSAKVIDRLGLVEYFETIKEMSPMLQIVPLVDHPFNRSKSNIAWIEGTWSGAVTIAPHYLEEFQKPGVVHYSSPEQLEEILQDFMKHPEKLEALYSLSFNYIKEHLLLSKVNLQREKLLYEKVLKSA